MRDGVGLEFTTGYKFYSIDALPRGGEREGGGWGGRG